MLNELHDCQQGKPKDASPSYTYGYLLISEAYILLLYRLHGPCSSDSFKVRRTRGHPSTRRLRLPSPQALHGPQAQWRGLRLPVFRRLRPAGGRQGRGVQLPALGRVRRKLGQTCQQLQLRRPLCECPHLPLSFCTLQALVVSFLILALLFRPS